MNWLGINAVQLSDRLGSVGNFQDQTMKKSGATEGQPASELISQRIAELADWRGKTSAECGSS
jgi:hypothetical protein